MISRKLCLTLCISLAYLGMGNDLFGEGANNEIIALTPEEEIQICEQRVAVMPTEELSSAVLKSFNDNDYFYLIHPDAYHYPVAVTSSGDNIQLHDGSVWYVHPYQRHLVKKWTQQDLVFIKPRSSCFSMYSYVLHNRVTQDAVEVELLTPPMDTSGFTFWVTAIDPYNRLVYLNDNSAWQINSQDSTLFRKWQVGHRVIVAVNNHWRVAKYAHILINTNMYNAPYCEANIAY